MRRPLVLTTAIVLLLMVAPTALAAGPHAPVDPATLTPPPSDSFDPTCVTTQDGVRCTGVEVQTFIDLDVGPDGFACDGHSIIDNGQQVRHGTFDYDAAGRLVRRFVRGAFTETWRLDGIDAPTLETRGQWSTVDDWLIPGDITSRIRTYHGELLQVRGPKGLVAHSTGTIVLDWDESNALEVHGPHPAFDAFIASVCAAFGV